MATATRRQSPPPPPDSERTVYKRVSTDLLEQAREGDGPAGEPSRFIDPLGFDDDRTKTFAPPPELLVQSLRPERAAPSPPLAASSRSDGRGIWMVFLLVVLAAAAGAGAAYLQAGLSAVSLVPAALAC